jgi:EmrB/QacA subfamily drug resistance transporter
MENQPQVIGLRSLPKKLVVITFVGVLLAMFLGALDQTIVGTAMPRVIGDLGGFAHYTWVTTAYLIASTVTVLITGRLTDIFGRKWFYVAGLCIFLVGSVFSGLSQTMAQLIIFRGLQGFGAGIMMANAFTVIADLFPPAERGKYQGFISGTWGLSSIIGPTLGGYITDSLSWHWIFFVNIPLAIIIIILFIFFFPHFQPDKSVHKIDWAGVAALILMIVPLMLGLTWGGLEYPWGSIQIIGLFCLSIVMLVVLLVVEKRAKEPIIPPALFSDPVVSVSLSLCFLTGMGMFCGITFVPLFFQGVLGLSATASGNFLTPMMLGQVCGSLTSGQVLSRTGGHYRIQGIIGLTIMAIGLFLLSRLTMETSFSTAVIIIVIMGFGLGITMPLYTIAIQNIVPYNILGAATSAASFFRSIGGSIGLAVFGTIMTNTFATDFLAKIPDIVKSAVPWQTLNSMAHNPQALVSADAQNQLKNLLSSLGDQGTNAMNQLLDVMRHSLNWSLSHVFLIGFGIIIAALIVTFFLREVPLRKKHSLQTRSTNPPTDSPNK